MTEEDTTNVWGTADVSSGKTASDENFPVGSFLISKALRPHIHAYYTTPVLLMILPIVARSRLMKK